ncbi:MAG: amino acid adenylation domain-containing protein, partial [Bacteroidota bacterium]
PMEEGDIEEETEEESSLNITDADVSDSNNYLMTVIAVLERHLNMKFSFNRSLLHEDYVEVMIGHFRSLINEIVKAETKGETQLKVGDLEMIATAERALILGQRATKAGEWFNQGAVDLGNDQPINLRFEAIAAAHPEAVAVSHDSTQMTYAELNAKANRIARYLKSLGLGPKDLVGVYLDRCPDLVACLMGILKSGAVYIPLDTQNPQDRIEKMIKNSGMEVVMTDAKHFALIQALNVQHILMMEASEVAPPEGSMTTIHAQSQIEQSATDNPENQNTLDSWAYLLFTSGTTGEPKAAITRHDGAMNHILAEFDAMELEDGFHFLQSAGIGSDISVWQILAPLLKGGRVVIIDKDRLLDVDFVLEVMRTEAINLVEFVPSYAWSIVEYLKEIGAHPELPDLRWIMMVGEAIPVKLVENWRALFPKTRILNGYGPCEASDDVTQFEVTGPLGKHQQRVPIGRPIANMNAFILNDQTRLLPIGVPGEIVVSGVGVGAGYYRLPQKTAASFIPNPFPNTLGDTMYRTGDLGRWLPDGNIEFLGRIDRQVKIRGHRVELGEIESFIRDDQQVADIHLVAYKKNANKLALIAFVIPTEKAGKNPSQVEKTLRAKCQKGLPSYMHPSYYCFIEQMPVNLSDKVDDKKLLKHFEAQGLLDRETDSNYVAPRNKIEEKLVEVWSKLLNRDKIGVKDNFFEIGGNSLVA